MKAWWCLALLAAGGDGDDGQSSQLPRISYLGLRCSDRPIDLHPRFDPTHYVYTSTLDFADGSFAVDALLDSDDPDLEIVDAGALQTTRQINPGDTTRFTVTVRSAKSTATTPYTVTVTRLDGSALRIRALEVRPSSISVSPVFDPAVLQYNVHLSAADEYMTLRIVPWDSGQTFDSQSLPADFTYVRTTTTSQMPPVWTPPSAAMPAGLTPQLPGVDSDDSADTTNASAADTSSGRRLRSAPCGPGCVPPVPSGETQYSIIQRRFPIEVNSSRLVVLRMRPANGDTSAQQVYRLQLTREPCPPARPLYSPDMKDCTVTCNVGYFANAARCAACSAHCLRCNYWDQCLACEASDWRKLRFIQLRNGFCQVVLIPWKAVAMAASVGAIAIALIISAWRCLCASNPDVKREMKPGRLRSERLLRPGFEQSDDE